MESVTPAPTQDKGDAKSTVERRMQECQNVFAAPANTGDDTVGKMCVPCCGKCWEYPVGHTAAVAKTENYHVRKCVAPGPALAAIATSWAQRSRRKQGITHFANYVIPAPAQAEDTKLLQRQPSLTQLNRHCCDGHSKGLHILPNVRSQTRPGHNKEFHI